MTPVERKRKAEERALADLRKWDCLFRDFGGWWTVPGPVNGPGQHHGPHSADIISRLVRARKVVLLRDRTRCVLWPGGAGR
jgi:hypothetical protein